MKQYDKVALVILDGWGHAQKRGISAIEAANIPFMQSIYDQYPWSELVTYGESVGLPDGQMGNSEVGHLNIGAGRVVYQELARINKAVREGTLEQNETLQAAMAYAKSTGCKVHLLGLVSDGGVHSHLGHLNGICDIFEKNGLEKVFIHAFTDGRDTDAKGGFEFLNTVQTHIEGSHAKIASVIGRYYAMDRDKRWERVKLAYDLLVRGVGEKTTDALAAIKKAYSEGTTDEFIAPIVVTDADGVPLACIEPNDVVFCYNFRTDRCREITEVLTQRDMPEFEMQTLPLHYVTMTRYNERFQGVNVVFEKDNINNTLGEILAKANKTQLRIAETEKYPHVTFFFNGGREEAFEGERRKIVPSPKVATYDLQPEMSAPELTDTAIADIKENQPDFLCLNFANADMVGHTGVFEAAVKAVEAVDACMQRLIPTLQEYNYAVLIIADHGNSDCMINEDGSPNTAHTVNPVPCILVADKDFGKTVTAGKLGDLAPTILELFGIEQPKEMDGVSLLAAI